MLVQNYETTNMKKVYALKLNEDGNNYVRKIMIAQNQWVCLIIHVDVIEGGAILLSCAMLNSMCYFYQTLENQTVYSDEELAEFEKQYEELRQQRLLQVLISFVLKQYEELRQQRLLQVLISFVLKQYEELRQQRLHP